MSDNTPLLTVAVLLEELKEVTDWRMLGAYLNVPFHVLDKINIEHDGVVEHCKMYMLQYWLDTTMTASWKDVTRALEHLHMLKLVARLKLKYLNTSPATTPDESIKNETGVSASPQLANIETEPSIDDAALEVDVKVISDLQDLENDFSDMMTDTREDLKKCDIKEIKFYLDDLFDVDEFRQCNNIDEVLRKLRRDRIDTFNIRYLECLVSRYHQSEAIVRKVEEYEEKKEEFLRATTVKQFQQAVVRKAEAVTPKGMAAVTIGIPKEYGVPRTMKDVEQLAKKGFKGRHRDFVKINVKPNGGGSLSSMMRLQQNESKSQSPTATTTSTDTNSQQPGDENHTSTTADEDTHTGTSPDAVGIQNRNLVKQYIERQGSLPVRSLKSCFIGPPCVGKTSARRRLMGEIEHISADEIVPSTGIDVPLTVRLHHPTEHSSVLLSEGWHNQRLEDQCRALCSYALNSPAPPPVLSSSTSATISSAITASPVAASHQTKPLSKLTETTVTTTQDAAKPTQDTTTAAQDELTTALTTLVKKDDWKSIRDFLTDIQELSFLNIVDIGGQPEFHEILPLLLHGLALNLIFLNTTQDLDSPYTVVYRDGTGNNSPQYTSESTIRQVIQRALCTISSLQTSDNENKSAAILIGTYCDRVDKSAVLALDQSIQESFKEAGFMKKDVLCAVSKPGEKRRYIYPLDNISGDPNEIKELRQLISTIVHDNFTPVMVPTSALLLHLILRMKFGHTRGWCTLEECIEIAKNCGISKEDLLREDGILQYLHDNFGTVLYYRKVNKLCLRVIVDTNVIMGPPSRLFLMAFGALKTKQQTAKHIRDTGKISHFLMTKVCSHSLDDVASDDDIPTDEIVELLKARYVIFEYPQSYSNDPVYFMPALLYPDHNVAKESSNPGLLARLPFPPVVFLPSSGDVPLGQFPATVVNLSKHWKPDEKNRYRNRIRFYAKFKDSRLLHVELRNLSTYLEFRVLSKPSINTSLMVESIQMLRDVFAELSSLYSHTQNITWSVGFYCPHSLQSGQQPHTATIDNPHEMICSQKDCEGGLIPLNDKHKSWFMVMPIINTTTTATPPTQGVSFDGDDDEPTIGAPPAKKLKNSSQSTDTGLDANIELNADNVLFLLKKHKFPPADWESLAVGLKLSHAVDEINANKQGVHSKLIALVNHWVANDRDKSWNKLVSAIEMSDQQIVADELAREVRL